MWDRERTGPLCEAERSEGVIVGRKGEERGRMKDEGRARERNLNPLKALTCKQTCLLYGNKFGGGKGVSVRCL